MMNARLSPIVAAALLAAGLATPSRAEDVSARTAPSQPARTEVASPMAISIPLSANVGTGWADRKIGAGVSFVTTETDRFVCDRAHVTRVQYQMTKASKKDRATFNVTAWLETGWFIQDVNLRFDLIADGRAVQSKAWKELTIGSPEHKDNPFAAQPRQLSFEWSLPPEQVAAIGAQGSSLRITLEIDD